jgi:uncharacterized protein YbjQ (UPF0145 family)
MDALIVITCLIVCYFTGSIIEKNHYKKIKQREVALYKAPCLTYGKSFSKSSKVKKCSLVSSSVVIGCDYFKSFLAGLRNIFGGNVSAYESVLDRGRREALLRMREYALAIKANAVINVKIETVMLDPLGTKQNPKVCVTAYGTAIEYDR